LLTPPRSTIQQTVSLPALDDARRTQLEQRLASLDALRTRHRRSQRRAPLWLLACVACIPAAMLWGATAAFYVVIVVLSMMSLVFYVAWNHEQECSAEQDAIRVMLAGGAHAVAAAQHAIDGRAVTPADPAEARTGAERDKQRAAHDRYRRPRSSSL
jgi:hypothetical protein